MNQQYKGSYFVQIKRAQQQVAQNQVEQRKQLSKEEILAASQRQFQPDEALMEIFSKWEIKTFEIQEGIEEMKLFSSNTLGIFIQALVVLVKTKKEKYVPYVYQILFSDKIQKYLKKEFERSIESQKVTYDFEPILFILENFIEFLFFFQGISDFIFLLKNTLGELKKRNPQLETLYQRVDQIQKLNYEYSSQFKNIYDGDSEIQDLGQLIFFKENYQVYKRCPIPPCKFDFSKIDSIASTICGDIDKQNIETPQDFLKYHFLLLRKDQLSNFINYVVRLRKFGFKNIEQHQESQIYLYYNIGIEHFYVTRTTPKILISANAYDNHGTKIDWNKTKRLLSGSFLALTTTKLESFIYAQVLDKPRKGKLDDRVYFTVKLINTYLFDYVDKINGYIAENEQLIIIENAMFYEIYHSYLVGLQQKISQNFPFKEQIIYNKKETPKNFEQLNLNDLESQLQQLYARNFYQQKTLDPSQQNAILTALNNKIALIQGPPGTGKTFCGALAVNLLLQKTRKPVLIVCQTNHALDQFLEHIMRFCGKEQVVRIGGRCSIPEFQEILLQNLRQNFFNQMYETAQKNKERYNKPGQRERVFLDLCKDNYNKNMRFVLNVIDNVHYKDVKQQNQYLVNKIVKQYQEKLQIKFKQDLCEQSIQLIVHMWLDCYQPKQEQFEKIINIEKQRGNVLLVENNYQQSFKDIQQQKYFVPNYFQQQQQEKDNQENENFDENVQIDSEEEENRKIYIEENVDDQQYFISKIDEKLSQKRLQNRLKFTYNEQERALQQIQNPHANIWEMTHDQRNALQQFILQRKIETINVDKDYTRDEYESLLLSFKQEQMQTDIDIIQSKKIVGLTLSGCAKYANKLSQIDFEILVIEEAGEVLESHLIAILSEKVQHLIMIGDHKQLRPNLNCYELQEKFQANISLFERLVNNGLEFSQLQFQRRMKSKFADFIRLIYDNYQDHSDISGKNEIKIQGIPSDLIFFNHKWDENQDHYSSSKLNKKEGRMIVKFVQYLLKNNRIEPEKISILSLYSKQALYIQHELNNEKVKVQTVDNFQGEENDIIIISLVRSNQHKKLGFVAIDNRICVALSRAKLGLYVFGNFDFIQETITANIQKTPNYSDLWLKIIQLAKDKNVLTDKITLSCTSHQETTYIQEIDDWQKVRNGGCSKICGWVYKCGHQCQEVCHLFPHDACQQKCNKILQCGHVCLGLCKQTPCPPCKDLVLKIVPQCQHQVQMECSQDPSKFKCTSLCEKIIQCGHQCKLKCSDDCQMYRCMEITNYEYPICKHQTTIVCDNQKYINKIICDLQCTSKLQCGHNCKGICGICSLNFHYPCQSQCDQILQCGHSCKEKCGFDCICKLVCSFKCNCNFKCIKKCYEECFTCMNQCQLKCAHNSCTKLCWEYCDREPCNIQCTKQLECGCKCIGLCGEICPKICEIKEHNNQFIEQTISLYYQLECENKHIFEIDKLDEYFESQDLHNLIKCPQCQTIIWNSSRYSKYIKESLNHYENLKKKGEIEQIKDQLLKVQLQVQQNIDYNKSQNIKDKQSFLINLQDEIKAELKLIQESKKCKIQKSFIPCILAQLKLYKKTMIVSNSQIELKSFKYHQFVLIDKYLLNEEYRLIYTPLSLIDLEEKLETLYLYMRIYNYIPQIQIKQQLLDAIEQEQYYLSKQERELIEDNLK